MNVLTLGTTAIAATSSVRARCDHSIKHITSKHNFGASLRPVVPLRWGASSRRHVATYAANAASNNKLYTRSGRVMVQQDIRYMELLEAIRNGEVKEMVFAQQGVDRSIAIFKNGQIRVAQLPTDDIAVADMMSVHGVKATLALKEPDPPLTGVRKVTADFAAYWLPAGLLLVVYAAVMYKSRAKGDWEDRQKLRELEKEKNQTQREQAREEAQKAAWSEEDEDVEESGDPNEFDEAKQFMTTNARVTIAGGSSDKNKDATPKSLLNKDGKTDKRVTFDDVAGIGEAKVELLEVVDFFKKPEKYRASGSRIPRGILLAGPPGCGKTLLARAVAGESGVAFFSMTASEFVEMFVGVGAARVRDLFAQAKKAAPAIVFIDELDAVGRKRGGGGGGNDERDQTLNQLLSELDGFSDSSGIVVMAATNRPDVLDTALIRPGRFDRKVVIGAPDLVGRFEVLEVHAASKPCSPDVDLKEIAFQTTGYTGAGLANIINMAALLAAKEQRTAICQNDLLNAVETESMGKVADTGASEERRKRLAVYEAGRAIIAEMSNEIENVELVTIVPREKQPNGQLRLEYNEARTLCGTFTRQYLHEQLVTVLGSRAAEELVYGRDLMSSINQNSLAKAREIASKMVMTAGMTDEASFWHRALALPVMPASFLGDAIIQLVPPHVSPASSTIADSAISEEMKQSYSEAVEILRTNRASLDDVVRGLMQKGTLTGPELREILERHGAMISSTKQKNVLNTSAVL